MSKGLDLLAIDLGASSGRAMLGQFDGERVRLRELHRFSNGPVGLPDGIHWEMMSKEPLKKDGTFDTVNTSFWDSRTQTYRSFTRYFEGLVNDSDEVDVLGADNINIRAINLARGINILHAYQPLTIVCFGL